MVVFPPYSLQRTPMHRMADVNVHMMTDEFMSQLTAELGVEIPPFKLHRRMRVTTGKGKDGETVLLVPFPSLRVLLYMVFLILDPSRTFLSTHLYLLHHHSMNFPFISLSFPHHSQPMFCLFASSCLAVKERLRWQ